MERAFRERGLKPTKRRTGFSLPGGCEAGGCGLASAGKAEARPTFGARKASRRELSHAESARLFGVQVNSFLDNPSPMRTLLALALGVAVTTVTLAALAQPPKAEPERTGDDRFEVRITDEMIAAHNMGDWRRDYDLSPLREFAHAGMEDIALVMLGHCQGNMTGEHWEDLLFNCVRGDTAGLIDECVGRLDERGLRSVETTLMQSQGMLPPAWGRVQAARSRDGLMADTAQASGSPPPTRCRSPATTPPSLRQTERRKPPPSRSVAADGTPDGDPRDARLGRIHPGNDLFTHETVGKLALGIDPDSQPRWG